MIVPSIDIRNGRAVQLRRGNELVLDGGDPLEWLEQFSVAGEVAVVDLDAALGTGSNADLIREMVRRAPCRLGGGIRTVKAAMDWLDAGAVKIMVATAASPEFCESLPTERVMAAVDAVERTVVVDGWRSRTGQDVLDRIRTLAPYVGGFLVTQVEWEGGMAGFDRELVRSVVEAAGGRPVTAAGGITTAGEVRWLAHLGADAQVGMALYSGRLGLGEAVAAPLRNGIDGWLWPTVVCDEHGVTLGLVWSTKESVAAAVDTRRGTYWSRSRNELWVKGHTSGATQELLRVAIDCDHDALRFTVRQHGTGFCHRGSRSCWPAAFDLPALERVIRDRCATADASSVTGKLVRDERLLRAKLLEEAAELASAEGPAEAAHELADLLYFGLVALVRSGGSLAEMRDELGRRSLRVRRRAVAAKTR